MQKPPKVGPAEEASGGLGVPSELQSSDPLQEASSLSPEGPAEGGPSQQPSVPQNVQDTNNWCCTITGLLCICAILLFLVVIMVLKVDLLKKRTNEEMDLWQWKILVLTEILRDLQIGTAPSCSFCKVQWVQLANKCFLFRDRPMGWHSSKGFCRNENAKLAMARDAEQMNFLKLHSTKRYYLDPEMYEYNKFWIGLAYNFTQGRWLWIDGTPFDSKLFGKLDHKGCAYLQNKRLSSQNCNETANLICEASIQYGWS